MSLLKELESLHNKESIAFELLGPPRLSKLLFEINILKTIANDMRDLIGKTPEELSQKAFDLIREKEELRSEMISIGIPILFPDGKSLLRGSTIKIPPYRGENELHLDEKSINLWAHDGWVDLRVVNMINWQRRLSKIIESSEIIPPTDTSSQFVRNKRYWNNFKEIDIGKIVGWIFIEEEQGKRMKA